MQRQCVEARDWALRALAEAGPAPSALLHAGRRDRRWARRSLWGRPVGWYRYTRAGGSAFVWPGGGAPVAAGALSHRPWRDLRAVLEATAGRGRWVGYFSYDLAYELEPAKLGPGHRADRGDWPLIELGFCPAMEAHAPPAEPAEVELAAIGGGRDVRPVVDRATYERCVERVLGYIGAGDVFQVNLAQAFAGVYEAGPRELFQRLAGISPAWYGAYLELPETEAEAVGARAARRALLSTSPELFLEVSGREVITRPIKGTRPVGADAEAGRRALLDAEKDAAELHMIVDLLRNDLGRVCDYGSVRVVEPRTIETHPTVHHGVASIAGRLHGSKDIVDLLRATLPGGSVTGAPKVRAMQIIDELEPVPRGPYCGAIGWITHEAACLNVAIRTMVLRASDGATEGRSDGGGEGSRYDVSFHVGGGIVADSEPAAEYAETLDKARAMLRALGSGVR